MSTYQGHFNVAYLTDYIPGRAICRYGSQVSSPSLDVAEEQEERQDHPSEYALHGRGRHPSRQEGHRVEREVEMLRIFSLSQD